MHLRLILLIPFTLIFATCVAQPFVPFFLNGKTKKQSLPLIFPPTTRTTGCALNITATNINSTAGAPITTVALGVTGTKTTSQFKATVPGSGTPETDVTSTTAWSSSDTTVATINTAGLVTAIKIGSTKVGPTCSPDTTITVNVLAVQNNLQEEKSITEIQNPIIENKETQKNED